MFARLAHALGLATLLASCLAAPPLRLGTDDSAAVAAHRAACAGKDGWSDAAPPIRVYGNVFNVGTCGITVLLLTGPLGHVLIDTGPTDAAPQVAANIEKLGYRLKDVRWIVASHEHFDHVGGLTRLKSLSGARVAALPGQAKVLESGLPDETDPQAGHLPRMEPVAVDRRLADGGAIELGNLRVVAHATPAHSPGSTSWTFRACQGRSCRAIAYADSLTTISTENYRFSDHPDIVARARSAFGTVAALPCDILVTPHPSAGNLFAKLHGETPLVQTRACSDYSKVAEQRLADRLATEAAGR